jgi:hypothetical protein
VTAGDGGAEIPGRRRLTKNRFAFALIPGQLGASGGTYALLFTAIGLPAAAKMTVARRTLFVFDG